MMLRRSLTLVACAGLLACVRVPNPNHEGIAGTGSETGDGDGDAPTSSGDGDGDASGTDGDGDGDSSTTEGDGDGDDDTATATTEGDGDGDTDTSDCEAGTEDCMCTVLETCNDDLACVLGTCLDASACGPVDDDVQITVTRNYGGGDPPPVPMAPTNFICSFLATDNGATATFQVTGCNNPVLQSLIVSIGPTLAPLEELYDVPLAASVTLVEAENSFYMRLNVGGVDMFYVDGASLFYDGVTTYPWPIAEFSSSCGATPSMCGETERLALLVDDAIVFDGNAAVVSDTTTAWVETNLDVCGVSEFELAIIEH